MSTALDTPPPRHADPDATPESEARAATAVSERRSRWGTVAWLASCLVIVVFVAGAWFRLRDEHGGDALLAQLEGGKRPVAPALPSSGIPGDGAPGLRGVVDGRPTVVNFWASWCGPCKQEMPALTAMADDFRGRVNFVGVDAGNEDPLSAARSFVRKYSVTYPIVRGDRADKSAWGVRGYPETFVLGADGRITWHLAGPVDADELADVLDAELEQDRS